jgi:hypothetical protein
VDAGKLAGSTAAGAGAAVLVESPPKVTQGAGAPVALEAVRTPFLQAIISRREVCPKRTDNLSIAHLPRSTGGDRIFDGLDLLGYVWNG